VAHVRQELALVLRGERELARLLLERLRGQLDLAVLQLDVAVLLAEQRRLLLQLLVGLAQLLLLGLQQLLGRLERLRLLLELGVRAAQLLLLGLQLLGALLQLAGELLGLLEQLLVRWLAMIALSTTPSVSESCSRNVVSTSENSPSVASSMTAMTCSSKRTGSTTMLRGERLAEARRDLDVVVGRLGDRDRLGLERRLADERLADLEAVGQALALLVAVGGDEPQLGVASGAVAVPLPSVRKNAPCWAETSGVTSDMIRRETWLRSRWPCMRPEIRARLEFSQSCSALRWVVTRRFSIIWLTMSLSSATSPEASTVTCGSGRPGSPRRTRP
jgi:hypothetical protein